MKIMHEIMYKLEVLYVLCVLLMGRQRNQVGLSPTSQAGVGRQCFLGVVVRRVLHEAASQYGSLAWQALGLISFSLRKPV